ncbi:MAG: helix-turn-helix transcriptional regulator [Chloroflexi bacterium]|nr:helix-turn-helix transcriptional regulator [Chloroflexota bacterium]
MVSKKATVYDEFEASLLENPEIRKEYEALKPKYEMIQKLIERRNKLNMSQTQLAKIIGTKQPAISRLERGDYNTTLGTLFKVASALDMDLEISLKANGETKSTRDKVSA